VAQEWGRGFPQEWGRGGGGAAGAVIGNSGTYGALSLQVPSWDSSEGVGEAVHMPAGVTVT